MSAHVTAVGILDGSFVSACPCGWSSAPRFAREVAEDDGRDHLRAQALPVPPRGKSGPRPRGRR